MPPPRRLPSSSRHSTSCSSPFGARGVDDTQMAGSQRSRLAAAHQHVTAHLLTQGVDPGQAFVRGFSRVGIQEHRQQQRLPLPQPGQIT